MESWGEQSPGTASAWRRKALAAVSRSAVFGPPGPANVLTFKAPGRRLTGSPEKREKIKSSPRTFQVTFFSPFLKGPGSKFLPGKKVLWRPPGVKTEMPPRAGELHPVPRAQGDADNEPYCGWATALSQVLG